MKLKLEKPQKVVSDEGWALQVKNRYSIEYTEGNAKFIIDVDFGPITGVYINSLRSIHPDAQEKIENLEKIKSRILQAIRLLVSNYEVCK